MDTCGIGDCERPKRKRGWCEMHYSRFKAHGTPHGPAKASAGTECVAPECERIPVAKGQCRYHYYANKAFRARARAGTAVRIGPQTKVEFEAGPRSHTRNSACSIPGCETPSTVRGWCGAHYQRWRRFGDPLHFGEPINTQCTVGGCNKVKNARGLCGAHYYRWQTYGDPLAKPIRKTANVKPYPPRRCLKCGNSFDPGISAARKYCGRKCAVQQRGGSVNRRGWVERLGERDGWDCHLCADPVDKSLYWPQIMAGSVDHIVPVSAGGTDAPGNLALAHLTCNTSRGASTLPA